MEKIITWAIVFIAFLIAIALNNQSIINTCYILGGLLATGMIWDMIEAKKERATKKKKRPICTAPPQEPVKAFRRDNINKLIYPEELPTFEELEAAGHTDLRAAAYAIYYLDTQRKSPFYEADLRARDFGTNRKALSVLKKKGLIEKLSVEEELEATFTKEELVALSLKRGLSTRGKKKDVAKRLADSGYKIDRRKHRGMMFRLSELGKNLIERNRQDERQAINDAISALKNKDYDGAVSAYRAFDKVWGFAHSSGKKHTIFAHYDVPSSYFAFFERYPMRELRNSDNFKNTLRACLIAGLMRGCKGGGELRSDFESVCAERIDCPRLLTLFDYDREVLAEMRKQIEFSKGNALEYYISHVEYLSRQCG